MPKGGTISPWITVDVEGDFGTDDLRGVDEVIPRVLDGFSARGIRATFFVVGEVARARPEMIRRIRDHHEVGSHGLTHRPLGSLNPGQRTEELRESKKILEDVTGSPVESFRAPFFDCPAGLGRLLEDNGYRRSSSKAPFSLRARFRHWLACYDVHDLDGTSVVEHPVSPLWGLPIPDGLSFRRLLGPFGRGRGRPRVFYFHPYELLETVDGYALPRWTRPLILANQGPGAEQLLWQCLDAWFSPAGRPQPSRG